MSKLNLQQLPKDTGYLASFTARPGHKLVYTDFNALEPKVTAWFTRDPGMWKLYGPGAKPNDIYLYTGANSPLFQDEIRQYYDPDNPTAEGIKAAKQNCGRTRDILKKVVLSCNYGAGPRKLHAEFSAVGLAISLRDCTILHRSYWRTFSGIKNFEKGLLAMHRSNGGWIINGRGRPLSIAADYTKDIVNRFVQSTGHDILMRYLLILSDTRMGSMRPWLVDEHDATIWECHESEVELTRNIFEQAFITLNGELGWDIKFTGDIKVADNLGELKGD